MLYVGYLIIVNGQNIKKISFGNSIFELLSADAAPKKTSKLPFVGGSVVFGVHTYCISSFPPSTAQKCKIVKKFYCLRQGTLKRGEGQPFLSRRGGKTA